MKSIRSLLLAALIPAALAGVSAHADELAQIKSSGQFSFGTEGTYAPFTFHDIGGKLTGFDVDIATEIARRLGVKPVFVEGKWDGLIAGLDAGRYDAVVNEVSITDARRAKYDFSSPYITSHAVLIVRRDNTGIKGFDDLKGKKSANTLTSDFGHIAASHGAEVVPVQGFNDAIALLTSGRVDATVNDSLSFLDFVQHQPNAPVKVVATDTSKEADQSGILLRKGDPALVAAVNKALADMKADGTYEKISRKYFGKDVSQ
jgi:cystine transport system substrate-binding protein